MRLGQVAHEAETVIYAWAFKELPFILDTMLQMPAFNPGKTIRVREVGADESCIAKLNRLPSIVFSSIK